MNAIRQEIIDRLRAIRGTNLLRHPYMADGCVYYKYSLWLTLANMAFIAKTIARGV